MAMKPPVAAEDILKQHIDRLLSAREHPKTICPSEVARSLDSTELKSVDASDWRDLMPEIRRLAWTMRDHGEVEVLQKGQPVPEDVALEDIKGPIRLRKVQ